MKYVLLMIGSLPPPYHGSNIYFQNLINSSVKDEFQIIHLNTSDNRPGLNNIGKIDLRNVFYAVKNVFNLFMLIRKNKPNLVYLSPSQNIAYLREAAFIYVVKGFSNAKIVQHFHGAFFFRFYQQANFILKFFIDRTQKKIDFTIVLGEKLKSNFEKWIPKEKIVAIVNGINIKLNHIKHNGKNVNCFFLGNLFKNKGLFKVIEAIGLLKEKYPQLKLNIAGNWGYDPIYNLSETQARIEIDNLISKYRLEDRVRFFGPVYEEKKIKFLEDNNILLYPTEYDALPLVILEAMAAGCPVITSKDIGAIPDVVMDGITGMLVDNKDIAQLTTAIEKLINNPELIRQMGLAARKRYEDQYTFRIHINEIINTFNEILATDQCVEF